MASPYDWMAATPQARLRAQYGIPEPVAGNPYAALAQQDAQQSSANQAQVMAEMGAPSAQAAPATPSTGSPYLPPAQAQPVTPKAKGSGLIEDNKATNSVEQDKTSGMKKNEVIGMTPDQIQAQYDALSKLPQFQDQQAGILAMQDQVNQEANRPRPLDFRPLAALADAWGHGHSNLAASMPAPETNQERAARILAYNQKLQQDRKDLANGIMGLIPKTGRAGTLEQYLVDKLAQKEGTSADNVAKDPNMAMRGFINPVTAANQFNTYAANQLKENDKSAQELGDIVNEVASGNPIDDNRIAILRAKLDAQGRPNIAEVNMEAGDQALLSRLAQTASKALSGKMSDHNRQLFLESMSQIAQLHQKERDMYVSKLKDQGRTQYQQSPEQLGAAFPAGFTGRFNPHIKTASDALSKMKQKNTIGGIGGGAVTAPAPAPSGGGQKKPEEMSNEELKAFIQSHSGGQ